MCAVFCQACFCRLAARSFARGFYDVIGTCLRANAAIDIELAFRAGIERFQEDGFELGDPEMYLHGPGHPHQWAPQLHGCYGCIPPVHGQVLLLRVIKGELQHLSSDHGWMPYDERDSHTNSIRSETQKTAANEVASTV